MLGRKCRFHDLAFFDPVIFESLRQLVIDAENKVQTTSFQEYFYLWCIHCHWVDLSLEMPPSIQGLPNPLPLFVVHLLLAT